MNKVITSKENVISIIRELCPNAEDFRFSSDINQNVVDFDDRSKASLPNFFHLKNSFRESGIIIDKIIAKPKRFIGLFSYRIPFINVKPLTD